MTEIKMENNRFGNGFGKYEYEPNKFCVVSQDHDFTYCLEFYDNTGKSLVLSIPKADVRRLSTINKYLAKHGYDFKFVQE